jgi:hypothetical protein
MYIYIYIHIYICIYILLVHIQYLAPARCVDSFCYLFVCVSPSYIRASRAPQVGLWRMLTCADVCWRMLTYADVSRPRIYVPRAHLRQGCRRLEVCWRMLTYADVCWRYPCLVRTSGRAVGSWACTPPQLRGHICMHVCRYGYIYTRGLLGPLLDILLWGLATYERLIRSLRHWAPWGPAVMRYYMCMYVCLCACTYVCIYIVY